MDIGERLRTARKAAGLTQEGVARRAGLTLKAVGEVERGEVQDPHYSTLTAIARALGMTVAELVGEESEASAAGKVSAPPETGQPGPPIESAVADAVDVSDDVKMRLVKHLEAFITEAEMQGLDAELIELAESMRERVLAA